MKATNRRRFLKQAGLAGAAIGFPTIIPAHVVGKGKIMPNDRIHVGKIGCGSIAGYYHRSAFKQMEDIRVVATCDAFRHRAVGMAKRYNKDYGSEVTTVNEDFLLAPMVGSE